MSRTRFRVDRITRNNRQKFAWCETYAGAVQVVSDQKSIDKIPPRERAKYEIVEVRK